jgi:predicted esterase
MFSISWLGAAVSARARCSDSRPDDGGQSRLSTWDVVDGYGPDVRRIDRLLAEVAAAHLVEGLTVGGFSDGASYAVSLGIANGDLFNSVLASSPGFAAPLVQHGSPRLFISHGAKDRVLPIDRCSR